MTNEVTLAHEMLTRHSEGGIEARVRQFPRLPSLGSVNGALAELLGAEQRYTSQIAEIIRRDPSLTSRLLRLVNSVYYGFSTPVQSIEEAVFFLGVRQVQQLAMVTPIIEDFRELAGRVSFPWRGFWQHCIGTAILTREVTGAFHVIGDESYYIAGLVHDVGKIAMAAMFPRHFAEVQRRQGGGREELMEVEREVLGMDHATLGAAYLRGHGLPGLLVEAAGYHHRPEDAPEHGAVVAAVQIADLLVRHGGIGISGDERPVTEEDYESASGWEMLFAGEGEMGKEAARVALWRGLERLPMILEGMV